MTRSEFLIDAIANCERCLAAPEVRYPNGRMSHEVNAEYLAKCESELADMRIDGLYDANGRFVAYADEA